MFPGNVSRDSGVSERVLEVRRMTTGFCHFFGGLLRTMRFSRCFWDYEISGLSRLMGFARFYEDSESSEVGV